MGGRGGGSTSWTMSRMIVATMPGRCERSASGDADILVAPARKHGGRHPQASDRRRLAPRSRTAPLVCWGIHHVPPGLGVRALGGGVPSTMMSIVSSRRPSARSWTAIWYSSRNSGLSRHQRCIVLRDGMAGSRDIFSSNSPFAMRSHTRFPTAGLKMSSGVRRRRVGQDLDPVGPCLAHGLCVVLT